MLVTNDVRDPVEALEIYWMKDTIEKHFDDLKNENPCEWFLLKGSVSRSYTTTAAFQKEIIGLFGLDIG